MTTLTPSAIPIKRFKIKPMIGLFAPTAATHAVRFAPVKFPTMAISDALNNCSRIPVAATGSAYCGSLFHMEPYNISIFCAFILCFTSFSKMNKADKSTSNFINLYSLKNLCRILL